MLNSILAIIVFLIAISVVVIVHEFGHFICARLYKIKILRFSIGFGWPLWCVHDKQGVEYVLAAVPLGGYVKMLDSRENAIEPAETVRAFDRRPICQRFMIICAGPFFNLLFSLFAFWIVFMAGITFVKPIVGAVLPNSLVANAGLQRGEEIIAINNSATPNWAAVSMQLVTHYGETGKLAITVRKATSQQELQTHEAIIDLRQWKLNALRPNPLSSLGIVPLLPKDAANMQLFHTLRAGPGQAFMLASQQVISFVQFNLIVLYKMITGVISWQSLGGPLTIFSAVVLAAGQGIVIFINFLALLSICVAVVNLLPIPGLDGAQLVYLLIEKIRGKPLSIAVQILAFRLGAIVLALIMVQAVLNDLLRLA